MKFKYFIFGWAIIILVFILFIFGNKKESQLISAKEHDTAVQLGLQDEGLTNNQILSFERVKDEEEIVFFSKDNALGLSCLSKNNDKWLWKRLDAMYDFESDLNTPSYMSSIIDIKTIKNNNYYVFIGKVFDTKIKKITLQNDTIYAKVVKINNNTFWYAIIDTKLVDDNLNYDIKAYDDSENEA